MWAFWIIGPAHVSATDEQMSRTALTITSSHGNQGALNFDAPQILWRNQQCHSHFILLGCGIVGSFIVFAIERIFQIYRAIIVKCMYCKKKVL